MCNVSLKEFNFEAEYICNHYVDVKTKKLWNVQLELLGVFKDICNSHNIKYFAGGGTLLGAVRHKGFIPWDDDIDVFTLADDYNRFCEIAKKEIGGDYFFQHYSTEKGFSPSMARIRKNNTTACTNFELNNVTEGYNLGIFIDIFPLHNVFENRFKYNLHKLAYSVMRKFQIGYEKKRLLDTKGSRYFKYWFSKSYWMWRTMSVFVSHRKMCCWYQRVCSLCKKSEKVGLISFLGFQQRYIWDKNYWDECKEVPFENITINIPINYDQILRKQYGDYNIFVKGTAIHTMAVFDADVPYSEKMREHFYRLKKNFGNEGV